MHLKVINEPDPQRQCARKARRGLRQQTAAYAPKGGNSRAAGRDCVGLCGLGDIAFAADVSDGGVFEEEVGGEHRVGDLAVIGAVADDIGGRGLGGGMRVLDEIGG